MGFPGVPTSTKLNDGEPPKYGFLVKIFSISGCDAYLKSELSPKLLEIDQDNLRTKLN